MKKMDLNPATDDHHGHTLSTGLKQKWVHLHSQLLFAGNIHFIHLSLTVYMTINSVAVSLLALDLNLRSMYYNTKKKIYELTI